MDRTQLTETVQHILSPPDDLSNDELDKLITQFINSVPHPGGSDLLFYPTNWGISESVSAKDIVDIAMSWSPKLMVMRTFFSRRHPSQAKLQIYGVRIPNSISTQVVSSGTYEVNSNCVVALSGVRISGERVAKHTFVDGVFSAGEILDISTSDVGTEVTL